MDNKYTKRFWISRLGVSLVCVGMMAAPADAATSTEPQWSQLYAEGVSALESETPTVAEQRLRKALTLVKKQSKNQEDIDKCMVKLSSALTLLDKTAEARSMLLQALPRAERAGGSHLTSVLMGLGSIEEAAGNHVAAMKYYNRALGINEKNYGTYTPEAAAALHGLGRVNYKLGNKSAATENYKRAITILSKEPNLDAANQLKRVMHEYGDLIKGNDQSDKTLIDDFNKDILNKSSLSGSPAVPQTGVPSVASNSSPISGSVSSWQQQSTQQLETSRTSETNEAEAVSLRGIHMPSSDQALKPAFKAMSDTVFGQDRYRASEAQYQRMIAADIDSLGPNHPSVANDLNGLAQLYIAQKKYSEAKQCLTRALAIYESTYHAQNALTINTMASLALVEANLGQLPEASKLYRESLANAQEILGPNTLETAKILNGLAFLYYQQGQLDKASTTYEWAIASTEQAVGKKDPLLAACLKDYATVLRGLDQNAKATEVETRAGQILSQ